MPQDHVIASYDVDVSFRFTPRNKFGDALDRDESSAGGSLTFSARTNAKNIGEAGMIMHEFQQVLESHKK